MGSCSNLTRVRATGQERRNKPESSAAKLYCLHLQEPESKRAREQEQERARKQEKEQEQESKSARAKAKARARESKQERKRTRTRKQEHKREKKQEQEREKARTRERENGKTPSLLRRIILRLGRLLPDWLQPICSVVITRKAEHMAGKLPLHVCRLCLLLRTQLSAPSCNGKCEGGFLQPRQKRVSQNNQQDEGFMASLLGHRFVNRQLQP